MDPKNLFVNTESQIFNTKLQEALREQNLSKKIEQLGDLAVDYSLADWSCDQADWLHQKTQQAEILFGGEQNPLLEHLQQVVIKSMVDECNMCYDYYFGSVGCKYCSTHHDGKLHIDSINLSTLNVSVLNLIGFLELAKRYVPVCEFVNTKDCEAGSECAMLHYNRSWSDSDYWYVLRFMSSIQQEYRDKIARQIRPNQFPFINILPRYCVKCVELYPPQAQQPQLQ